MRKQHAFFSGAILLVIAALFTHSVARGFLEEAIHRRAARVTEVSKQHTAYVPDPLATQASHKWNVLTGIGIALTALSVICMVTALARHEPGWYLILLLLLFSACVLPMLL